MTYGQIYRNIRGTTIRKLWQPVWPPSKISKKTVCLYVYIRAPKPAFGVVCLWCPFFWDSQDGGLRPPSSSPLRGARVLAPDCRGPTAPSSQSPWHRTFGSVWIRKSGSTDPDRIRSGLRVASRHPMTPRYPPPKGRGHSTRFTMAWAYSIEAGYWLHLGHGIANFYSINTALLITYKWCTQYNQ